MTVTSVGPDRADANRRSVDLRDAFRRHPEGVAVVTTVDELGNQWGMTVTSLTSVSLDPPLLLVCLVSRSGLLGPLRAGGGFVVHLLSAHQADLARRFATPAEDKFVGARYGFAPNGCARLSGVLASLDCVAEATHPGGDHEIVVGRVIEACVSGAEPSGLVFFNAELLPISTDPSEGATS